MPNKTIDFHSGLVTSRDPSTLRDGELTVAIGCEYRVGSPHLYKQPGRTRVAQANITSSIVAMHLFQYENATDKLIAIANSSVHEADVSLTPTFGAAGLATGYPTVDVPSFSSFNNSWVMVSLNGDNYIREAGEVFVDTDLDGVNDWTDGNWRPLGMARPSGEITIDSIDNASGAKQNAASATGAWVDNAAAWDEITQTDDAGLTSTRNNENTASYKVLTGTGTSSEVFSWAAAGPLETEVGGATRYLHLAVSSQRFDGTLTLESGFGTVALSKVQGYLQIEVSEDGGSNYTSLGTWGAPFSLMPWHYEIDSATALEADLKVRVSIVCTLYTSVLTTVDWLKGAVHDVKVDVGNRTSAELAVNFENDVSYLFTERYLDSDNVVHESAGSKPVVVQAQDSIFGIEMTLPATPVNTFTTEYVIYRSLDIPSGGYPIMYQIDTLSPYQTTTYTDTFRGDDPALVPSSGNAYAILWVLYPDNSTLPFPINTPPPSAKKVLPFQGSMVYVPNSENRIYYSIAANISSASAEQVPELYYLEFLTPDNDVVQTAVGVNNGRGLMVYFPRYTMLVTLLPQATDPGIFDTRATEYVTQQRGAAGPHCAVEVDLGGGRTIAVAMDALGVWASDGVSAVQEWSRDLDWDTAMAGVTLAGVQLWNNPEMRRVEMHFSVAATNSRFEYHFFYGRMKKDADGNDVPLITGPHQMVDQGDDGILSKHYNLFNNAWTGWSGGGGIAIPSSFGDVFIERAQDSDDSNGYDGSTARTGTVPFQVTTGDYYYGGLGRANILTFGYPKFAAGAKSVSMNGTFRRDGSATAQTPATKTFIAGTQKKVYWHRYADRHKINITDITNTSMPALVSYEVEVRDSGIGRDQ